MRKIILISCVSQKLPHKSKARFLYTSPLFKKNMAYAQSLNPDVIYILSAKYGLVELDQEIEPYDLTLNHMSADQIKMWAIRVLAQLSDKEDLQQDHFIFLAGEKYRKYLLSELKSYEIPLEGLPIGKQLQFLTRKNEMSQICHSIHQPFNSLTIFSFPFNARLLPENGIYILFEDGEQAHGMNRIVRVGTHTGKTNSPPV